jgi:hypothetical protein
LGLAGALRLGSIVKERLILRFRGGAVLTVLTYLAAMGVLLGVSAAGVSGGFNFTG